MTAAQVVADTERLDGAVIAEIGAVCARASAELLPWRSLAASRPILIVGALGHGERQIPAPLLEAVNARGAALMLLSDDSLVRPVVATHGGRVTCASERPSWLNTRLSQRGSRSSTTVERPTSGTTPST